MTTDTTHESPPAKEGVSYRVSPLLTVRLLQVVLWLVVVSGPIAAAFLATQVSALAGRLELTWPGRRIRP